jgi:hypothetical protein
MCSKAEARVIRAAISRERHYQRYVLSLDLDMDGGDVALRWQAYARAGDREQAAVAALLREREKGGSGETNQAKARMGLHREATAGKHHRHV